MKRLREYFASFGSGVSSAKSGVASFTGQALAGAKQRLASKPSLIWLGLFGTSLLLELCFNLPAAVSPATAFLPTGTLAAAMFAGWCGSLFGKRRALYASAGFVALVGPLFQPLLALPLALAVAGVVAWRVRKRQWRRPLLCATLSIPLTLTLYVALLVLVSPAVHAITVLLWSCASTFLAGAVATLGTVLIGTSRRWKRRKDDQDQPLPLPRWRIALNGVALAALWLFVPFTIVANRWDPLVTLQMRHDMDTKQVETLVPTVNDRMLPRTTAETYMQNLNKDYMTSLEAPHLQHRQDGSGLWWQSAVHNDNRWGRIFGSANRVLAVDADRVDSHAEATADSAFIFADRSWVTRGVFAARHPFSQVAEISYYQNADKSWSMLLSHTSKKMTWTLPGLGVMVPCYSGVMEVTQSGFVRDWTVHQAAKRFPGAVLYPAALYRQQAEAYGRWHDGWTGAKLLQKNVYEVSEDDSPDATLNRQPYVQHFKDLGMQLMIAFEPKGDKQWALTEVLLADASTGKLRSLHVPAGLIGPRQARLSVRSSDTRIDWSHIRKVEPRLVVAPRGVFWLVAIVSHWENEPDRHPYVTSVLVDALRTSDCFTFQHQSEMEKFLNEPRPKD
jgi:hypothetical protein